MFGRLDMHGDDVAAGFRERGEIGIARLDHEMAVEGLIGTRPQRLDHRRAERDVGDEMPVHHVEMNPVGVRGDDVLDFLAELGEVGRRIDGAMMMGLLMRRFPSRRLAQRGAIDGRRSSESLNAFVL